MSGKKDSAEFTTRDKAATCDANTLSAQRALEPEGISLSCE